MALEHDLWNEGENVFAVLPPTRSDLFVLVIVDGKVALRWPVSEYERAEQVSHAFARRIRVAGGITIKVLPVTLKEAQAMGFAPGDLFADQTPVEEAEWRQLVRETCLEAVESSNDPAVRADAMNLLKDLGVMQK